MVELEISVMTDEFDRDLEKVCGLLSKEGVKYVELRNVYKKNVLNFTDDDIARVKELLEKYNMKVSSISGGILKYSPPMDDPNPIDKKTAALFNNALHVAEELDAPYIRIFGYSGKFNVPPVSQWDNWEIYQRWSKTVNLLKKKADEKGKMLICENDSGFNKSLEQIERIGKDHCGPGFGMLFDTANAITSFGKKAFLTDEWLDRLVKYIQFIHAKGVVKKLGFIYKTSYIYGEKDLVNWPKLIRYLRQMEPNDFVAPAPSPLFLSIETHFGKSPRWDISVQNLKNLKKVLGEN